jgi:ribonuclease R
LADDFYHFDRRAHTLTGRRAGNTFRLGDLVRVEVARVDVDRRELDFRIVERKRRSPLSKATPASRDGRGRKGGKVHGKGRAPARGKTNRRPGGKRRR